MQPQTELFQRRPRPYGPHQERSKLPRLRPCRHGHRRRRSRSPPEGQERTIPKLCQEISRINQGRGALGEQAIAAKGRGLTGIGGHHPER